MGLSIDDAAAIRAAAIELSGLAPASAALFTAARNLLLQNGWTRRGQLVVFHPGIVVGVGHCSCAEGARGLCIHKLAVRLLCIAEEHRAGVARAAGERALLVARTREALS